MAAGVGVKGHSLDEAGVSAGGASERVARGDAAAGQGCGPGNTGATVAGQAAKTGNLRSDQRERYLQALAELTAKVAAMEVELG